MRGKKFYVLLIGLLLVGLGSIFFYRQQEEQRVLEFEGYEISAVKDRVETLYNAEKTDIAQNISTEELEELENIFEELDEKKLSRRSRDQIQELRLDFLIAQSMLETEAEVEEIFVDENVIDKDVAEDAIDELEYEVLTFENMPDYVDRNIERLAYGRQQVVEIDRAIEYVESLFDEEENVLETVTREEEAEARELIEAIQNEEVREELTARVETVRLVLTEREEQLALEAEIKAAEELEEEAESQQPAVDEEVDQPEEPADEVEEPQYTAPPNEQETPPVQTWTPPAPAVPEEPAEEEPDEPEEPANEEDQPDGEDSGNEENGNTDSGEDGEETKPDQESGSELENNEQ